MITFKRRRLAVDVELRKKLEIDPITSEVVKRIYDIYTLGYSHFNISVTFNKENVLNKSWTLERY